MIGGRILPLPPFPVPNCWEMLGSMAQTSWRGWSAKEGIQFLSRKTILQRADIDPVVALTGMKNNSSSS